MKTKIFVLCLLFSLFLCINVQAQIIFQDNFNSSPDWTVAQPVGSTVHCANNSCGVPGGWTGYYNGVCKCWGVSGAPGNNLLYINQYAGYPNETNTCRGGSGKCLTVWMESCTGADDADGQITKLLDQEYEEIYIRFYIKFKPGYELRTYDPSGAGSITKLYHIQHYVDGSPHAYFGTNLGNQPVSSGGITEYGSPNGAGGSGMVQFYAEARCQTNYYCHSVIPFNIGTYAQVYDGNWHSWEMRFKRNSSIGVRDGIIEFWFDGVKKNPVSGYYNTDIAWNDTGSSRLRGWKYVMLAGNTNNRFDLSCSDMADCEQWYAIDDVVISTTYIGPGTPIDNPPQAPRGLSIIQN